MLWGKERNEETKQKEKNPNGKRIIYYLFTFMDLIFFLKFSFVIRNDSGNKLIL
jgi:hypothetical protein